MKFADNLSFSQIEIFDEQYNTHVFVGFVGFRRFHRFRPLLLFICALKGPITSRTQHPPSPPPIWTLKRKATNSQTIHLRCGLLLLLLLLRHRPQHTIIYV